MTMQPWDEHGFTSDQPALWQAFGFSLEEAIAWRNGNYYTDRAPGSPYETFTPLSASAWWAAGFAPAEAGTWRSQRFNPEDAREWWLQGFTAEGAARCRRDARKARNAVRS